MTYDQLIVAYPEAQAVIQAKAAGLPGAFEEFKKFRNSLPQDAQLAFIEEYEREITSDFEY